ncbi:heme NO-binding domain-containing protein [Hymenobacter sp. YC55]|uniref:heme NO-binding domain-containing protein n=1 Tax=Hymenobacter sp. YC55 TaxID=3034019 RepID=UPI0023F806FE|nr:heme NO-binding domain-containing protein [Hymenobacter sp. YC55]MDF7811233.1 heme NO-binding domain-containing protein [Hymenobacter sp. YC55]
MHGTVFILLKRYVQTQYDHSTWVRLVEAAGLTSGHFDHKEVYPDEHMYALVGKAAEMTGIPANELHEKFGEYLVPDLMYMYQKLIQPNWKTLDMIEHTENTMHRQVRSEHTKNAPPVLHVVRHSPDELEITYVSQRRMGALAVGIVRGLAAYFDEADHIVVEPETSENGEHVLIRVKRLPAAPISANRN